MNSKACILIHYHEISLKGDNRGWFEKVFKRNVRAQVKPLPFTSVETNAARVFIFGVDANRWDEYATALKKVMGLMNAHLMHSVEPEMDAIKSTAAELISHKEFETFRVSTKRQYKNFPYTSQEVNREIGAHIQPICNKRVKLKGADLDVVIELVNSKAYIGVDKIRGYGGLPVGTGERAISLLSSGIDSPVSSFEMIKRGVSLSYVHFHSAPATSRQSIKNVERLLEVIVGYQIRCDLYNIPLLAIQEKIMETAPSKFWVILFRRAMMRMAEQIAEEIDAVALITGENVGQVASQTLSNMRATADVVERPILRPLAGLNKEDIVNRAREIGTYEISIEPYEDCCSFFVPIHPETRANLEEVRAIEASIDMTGLYETAMENIEKSTIEGK
ncbi:MAG: tRNA 4-thiouridine(8) synthase ThiI [Candidatus Marinimicrobia bacterium]|nr:tRNA 4-thiouridine(8) synthase ThiI [Candidatus Neomarinimicrobiota bacterium]